MDVRLYWTDGGALGPMLNFYAAMPNGPIVIAQALGLTGMVF